MRKISILDAKTLGKVPNLSRLSAYGQVTTFETTGSTETIQNIGDAEIVITNKVIIDKHIINNCPNLKLICISATGTNNVDLYAAEEKGIAVKNAVGYSSNSVAQHTFACLLQLLNRIDYFDHYVKSNRYSKSDIFTHFGPAITELNNKRFGIIGLGNIGKAVARIASGFNAEVIYYSTSGKNTSQDYPRLEFEELLKTSDIISVHAPLNEQTKNLISSNQFPIMKPTAIIINVGRGGIVDEAALAEAINSRTIHGACMDVFEREPIDADNPLLKVKYPQNLILTPHNAWASMESRTKLVDIVCENIEAYLRTNT
ncbi:MAG: D-2-hydroxyacid dehydrogenase [Cytophagales bacterium]|nr:D-2-hydroxyacid dehydrogenase [Cytophagales bacterium]